MECSRPLVCVLTDGSGSGRVRTGASIELIHQSGSAVGPVMGAFTDVEIYDALLRGDVTRVLAATETIAESLVTRGIRAVVADAFEFYNPTHDLCSIVATLALSRAERITGTTIERYEYAVTQASAAGGLVTELDGDQVERKMTAAYRFENLTSDVDALLAAIGRDEVSREVLRPISSIIELPAPVSRPYYEVHGEARVASGRYRTVLRYEQHFVPFVRELAAALRVPVSQPARLTRV